MIDFSKIKGKIYFDGKFIDTKKAKIHVLNHSLHFAASVFEGISLRCASLGPGLFVYRGH